MAFFSILIEKISANKQTKSPIFHHLVTTTTNMAGYFSIAKIQYIILQRSIHYLARAPHPFVLEPAQHRVASSAVCVHCERWVHPGRVTVRKQTMTQSHHQPAQDEHLHTVMVLT